MASYTHRDTVMLTEAYSVQLLKESVPNMTLDQVSNRLHLMCESELVYVNEVAERILEGVLGDAWSGIKNVAGTVGNSVANAAQSVGNGVGNSVQRGVQSAKNVGAGIAAGAGQLKDNIKNTYTAGANQSKSATALKNAQASIQQLTQALIQADAMGLIGKRNSRQWMNQNLSAITKLLDKANQQAGSNAQAMQKQGLGNGVGSAAQSGYQTSQQQAQPQQTP